MKKIAVHLIVNLILSSSLICYGQVKPFSPKLKVGDIYPELSFAKIINYHSPTTSIREFKGKHLILDFWASWCAPCVQAFPRIDSMQKKYKGRLTILPITIQDESTVSRLFANLNQNKGTPLFACVVDDTIHKNLSGHRIVPHYVWIGADGVVKAITDSKELTWQNIEHFVNSKPLHLALKEDKPSNWDGISPLFLNQFLLDKKELLYHSVLLKFRQELPNGSYSSGNKITCPNHSMVRLFQLACGEFQLEYLNYNRVILEGVNNLSDSLAIGYYDDRSKKDWLQVKQDHLFSYELVVDSSFDRNEKFDIMRNDLNRYFSKRGISGKKERRLQKCMALVRISGNDKVATKGGSPKDLYTPFSIDIRNLSMMRFISKFQAYFYKEGGLPIIDETGYSGKIDISINCDLSNLNAVNDALQAYDLRFMEKETDINMIVITMQKK